MPSFILDSPLPDATVGEFYRQIIGVAQKWAVPPGSILPPGLRLDDESGELIGVPTIQGSYSFYLEGEDVGQPKIYRFFILEITNASGMTAAQVNNLIESAFALGKSLTGQKFWVAEELDGEGNKVFALKVDDNGNERTIATSTI